MATKTIGSGGDYATPALWFASLASSLAANERGEFLNQEVTVTATQSLTGITVNGFTITMTAGSGNSFADNANKLTNALRYNSANGAGLFSSSGTSNLLDIQNNNFTLSKLQLKKTTDYGCVAFYTGNTYDGRIIEQCIIEHAGGGGSGQVAVVDGTNNIVRNCLLLASKASNPVTGLVSAGGDNTISNLTIASSGTNTGTGFSRSYGSPVLKNVVVAGFNADYAGTVSASSSNNATDKGAFGGTNYGASGQVSVVGATEFQSVTNGSEDYRIKSATAVKLPLNGTATGTPSTDIVGQTRSGSTPTIGGWELVAAAGGVTPHRRGLLGVGT